MMSAKYFEYYTIILRAAVFSWTHCTSQCVLWPRICASVKRWYTIVPSYDFLWLVIRRR